MAEPSGPETGGPERSGPDEVPDRGERVPAMQLLIDNPFLLLFIGVAVPAVLYTIWGIMEIVHVPLAQ